MSKPSRRRRGPFRTRTVRVRFEDSDRPVLIVNNLEYPILELMKTSVRVRDLHEPRLPLLEGVTADVVYPHGKKFTIDGVVEKHSGDVSLLRFLVSLNTGRINRRDRFRVKYPIGESISVKMVDQELEVNEIAEHGIRIVKHGETVVIGEDFRGTLVFREGDSLSVSGKILRDEGEEYVIYLDRGIPLKKVMSEQLYLLRKYPR